MIYNAFDEREKNNEHFVVIVNVVLYSLYGTRFYYQNNLLDGRYNPIYCHHDVTCSSHFDG